MSTKDWMQFRKQLFETMEERRAKAAIFHFEQLYNFICRCRQLCVSPGSREAQHALEAIQDEGTFLLVANSGKEFVEMFSAVEDQENADQAPIAQPHEQSANAGPDLTRQSNAPADRNVARPARELQGLTTTLAPRHDSGRPFRR